MNPDLVVFPDRLVRMAPLADKVLTVQWVKKDLLAQPVWLVTPASKDPSVLKVNPAQLATVVTAERLVLVGPVDLVDLLDALDPSDPLESADPLANLYVYKKIYYLKL